MAVHENSLRALMLARQAGKGGLKPGHQLSRGVDKYAVRRLLTAFRNEGISPDKDKFHQSLQKIRDSYIDEKGNIPMAVAYALRLWEKQITKCPDSFDKFIAQMEGQLEQPLTGAQGEPLMHDNKITIELVPAAKRDDAADDAPANT